MIDKIEERRDEVYVVWPESLRPQHKAFKELIFAIHFLDDTLQ